MTILIDLKYINFLSHRLPLFKKKGAYLFNFRCTLCGDSQLKKNKARGYFYKIPKKNIMAFKCHNCASSMYFGSFLKTYDSALFQEYLMESYKEKIDHEPTVSKEPPLKNHQPQQNKNTLLDSLFDRLDTLDDTNEAVAFCIKRKIPREKFNRLYYIDNVKKIENLTSKYTDKIKTEEPRLVLPFYSERGEFEGISCRALRDEHLRYLTVKVKEDASMIFGAECFDKNKKTYVVEGPIDSLFLPNAIAVGSTAFDKIETLNIPKKNVVIILDNQPRNREVLKQYQKYITRGYNILIWPQIIKEKDINEFVLNHKTNVVEMIDENTFVDLKAALKLTEWRRV